MCGRAYAFTENYDIILDEMIKSEGVFDGRKGVVYAEIAGFEYENSLFTVTVKDGTGLRASVMMHLPALTPQDP